METPSESGRGLALDASIDELEVSARVRGLFARRGVRTLGDALALDPTALMDEKNFGRRSLAELRAALERATGRSWEDARESLPLDDGPAATASQPRTWNAIGPWLPASLSATPLDAIGELPARVRSFARLREIHTLGALFAIPASALVDEPNLGRKSLADTIAIAVALARGGAPHGASLALEDFASFSALFRAVLAPLRPIERIVLAGRAGASEPPATLHELGEMLGVTRERVRQLELRGLASIRRDRRWLEALDARLTALAGPGPTPRDAVSERDPWLASLWDAPSIFDYVCDKILDGRWHRVDLDEVEHLSPRSQSALDACWSALNASLTSRAYPCALAEIDAAVGAATSGLGEGVRALFSERARARLEVREEDRAAGYGADRRREMLQWLAEQPEPVSVSALTARFGRGRRPDELVVLARGRVWARERLEGFDAYVGPVSAACVAHMTSRGPERQWSCDELAREVVGAGAPLPPWFGPGPLAALLRRGGLVRYLGRGVVALPDVQGERVHIHALLEQTLREAGAPLALDELARRARDRRAVTTLALAGALRRPPFVRVGPGVVGLWDRDVAGEPSDVTRANEQVFQWLSSAGVGLSARRALERLSLVHPIYIRWNTDILRSAWLRDARLQGSAAGTVGLIEWEDPRVPSRKALVEAALVGGRAELDAIIQQIERVHGETLTRGAVAWMARAHGATREGDTLVVSSRPEDVPSEAAALFPQLPRRMAIELEALASEPSPVDALGAAVDAHTRQLYLDAVVNEGIDLDLVCELQRRSHALLANWGGASSEARRWILAAVRYFIESNEAASDFVEAGLEDDRAVIDAVEGWLQSAEALA
jgi:hypothetical protein